jgi:hypothetical protein
MVSKETLKNIAISILLIGSLIGLFFLFKYLTDNNNPNDNITPSTTLTVIKENPVIVKKEIVKDEILDIIKEEDLIITIPPTTTLPPPTTTIPPRTTVPPPTTTVPQPTTTVPPRTTAPPPITQEPFLYPFTTFTFTSAEKYFNDLERVKWWNKRFLNSNGPSLDQIRYEYIVFNGYPQWISDDKFFNMKTNNGIQLWTVPVSGYYDIKAVGASGGGAKNYGKGRDIQVNAFLKKGEIIQILIGQIGIQTPNNSRCGSGGGGTFVVRDKETPIIIAGGGGGCGYVDESPNSDASSIPSGNNGGGNIDFGLGGENGYGGTSRPLKYAYRDTWWKNGSAGGGLLGNGKAETQEQNTGQAFINGGLGGNRDHPGLSGGFGGGGGYSEYKENISINDYGGGGGGGGGYSGGGEGGIEIIKNSDIKIKGGGGGGSFAISKFIDNGATNIGNGSVTITLKNITPIATNIGDDNVTITPIITTSKPVLQTIDDSSLNNYKEIIELEKNLKELNNSIEQQKEKEKEDLFNIPLIPVFNPIDTMAIIPSEGFYNIYAYGDVMTRPFNPPGIRGTLGNLFDNNNTTGIDFVSVRGTPWKRIGNIYSAQWPTKPPLIIITMPVFKTFKGKVIITLTHPTKSYGTPTKMSVNTAQSLNLSKFNDLNLRYHSSREYTKEFIESSILDINFLSLNQYQSFDLNFTIKFNTIIFEILERDSPYDCYISNISFIKSR